MSRYGFTTAFAVAAIGDLVVLTTIAINYRSLDVVESASSVAAVTGVAVEMPSDGDMKKRQGFLAYVLKLLGLDEKLQIIQTASGGPGSRYAPADAAAPPSDSADPPPPR
jgi:hypothetical protein